jgi:hypothetical protein
VNAFGPAHFFNSARQALGIQSPTAEPVRDGDSSDEGFTREMARLDIFFVSVRLSSGSRRIHRARSIRPQELTRYLEQHRVRSVVAFGHERERARRLGATREVERHQRVFGVLVRDDGPDFTGWSAGLNREPQALLILVPTRRLYAVGARLFESDGRDVHEKSRGLPNIREALSLSTLAGETNDESEQAAIGSRARNGRADDECSQPSSLTLRDDNLSPRRGVLDMLRYVTNRQNGPHLIDSDRQLLPIQSSQETLISEISASTCINMAVAHWVLAHFINPEFHLLLQL